MMGPSLIPASGGSSPAPAVEDALTVVTESPPGAWTVNDVVRIDEFADDDYADIEVVSGGAAGATSLDGEKAHAGLPGNVLRLTMTVGELKAYVMADPYFEIYIGAGGVDDAATREGGNTEFGGSISVRGQPNDGTDESLLKQRTEKIFYTMAALPLIADDGSLGQGVSGPVILDADSRDGPGAGGSVYSWNNAYGGKSGIYPKIGSDGLDPLTSTPATQIFGRFGGGGESSYDENVPGQPGAAPGGGGAAAWASNGDNIGGDGGAGVVRIRLRQRR